MSYRLRLLIGIIVVIIPVLILLTLNRMSIIRTLIFEREIERLDAIGQLLAKEIEDDIEQRAPDVIQEVLALSVMQTDIYRIHVLDADGIIRFSSDTARIGKSPMFSDTTDIYQTKGDTYAKSYSITSRLKGKYHLLIISSLAEIRLDLERALHWAEFFSVILFAASTLIAWIVSGHMERPVRQATEFAKNIAKGNFDMSIRSRTNDAYGQLLSALDSMARNLKELTWNMQNRIDTATAELVEKNARLTELDILKSDFVAMVSHDLRTPLTSIIGFSRTLQRTPMEEAKRIEYLGIIEREGKQLASLIEEYLDISKIESGNFSLSTETADLGEVIAETVAHSELGRNTAITGNIAGGPFPFDVNRLRRVFNNLLENSARHGGRDVSVTIELSQVSEDVRIRFADNGPGIPPGIRHRIFDRFFQGNSQVGGGSGLGLAITKAILEAHGGSIRLDSGFETGAAFIITLPRNRSGDSNRKDIA